ncbi:MAG TPA: hypothetical protein VHA12_02445 [Candidatus Nanoarchaeia archaeon]|nr:hypothetical protein [Candidatus Nanoarchaeia archaeon]
MKRIDINKIKAKSLSEMGLQAIETARTIEFEERHFVSIMRELYEGLRQYCEAIGYFKGYKFDNHEEVGLFLRKELKEESVSIKFDRYRILRNKMNYDGLGVNKETVKEALEEIPKLVEILSKYISF